MNVERIRNHVNTRQRDATTEGRNRRGSEETGGQEEGETLTVK